MFLGRNTGQPHQIKTTRLRDLCTPTEISRTSVFDLRTPTEIYRTGGFDHRTPTEIYRTGGFDLMRLPWEETGCNSRFGRVAWKKQAVILDLGVLLGRNRPEFSI